MQKQFFYVKIIKGLRGGDAKAAIFIVKRINWITFWELT